MLLIEVRVGPSSIHGIGVFAAQAVARGTEVWRFTPGFDLDVDPALLAHLTALQRERLMNYGYIDLRLQRYVLCCDDARFINHSDTPSLRSDFTLDRYGVDFAVRDIAAGEELTLDYGVLDGTRP